MSLEGAEPNLPCDQHLTTLTLLPALPIQRFQTALTFAPEPSKAVVAVYEDRGLWEARSLAAPGHVAAHFSRATQVRELGNILCAVVSKGKVAR